MKFFFKYTLLVLLIVCLANSGFLYGETVNVNFLPAKEKIFLGDKVKFVVKIKSDGKILKINDNLTEIFKRFNIENINRHIENYNATISFTLQFFQTGEIELPEAVFRLKTKDEQLKIYSNKLKVNVLSNLSDNSTFKGIKSPLPVKFYLTGKEWITLIITFIVLAMLIFLLLAFFRRKKVSEEKFVYVSPKEEFSKGIMKCEELLKQGKIREFYFLISEITRRYIDRKFDVSTLEATLKEIEKIFSQNNNLNFIKEGLLKLFKKWEFYKFTNIFPEGDEASEDLKQTVSLLSDSDVEPKNE